MSEGASRVPGGHLRGVSLGSRCVFPRVLAACFRGSMQSISMDPRSLSATKFWGWCPERDKSYGYDWFLGCMRQFFNRRSGSLGRGLGTPGSSRFFKKFTEWVLSLFGRGNICRTGRDQRFAEPTPRVE